MPPIATTATPSRSAPRLAARARTAARSLSPSTRTATSGIGDDELGDQAVHDGRLFDLQEVAGVPDQLEARGVREGGGRVLGVRRLQAPVVGAVQQQLRD